MATLSVWRYDTPDAAQRAADTLASLQKQELIQVHDVATVSWQPDATKPRTKQGLSTTGTGALSGTFWGMLFGLIFLMPLLGAAIGAATGAIAGALTDVGIDDDFIRSIREKVTPGTSALFALTSGAVLDKVHAAMAAQGLHGELVQTNLTGIEEANLRAVFDEMVV